MALEINSTNFEELVLKSETPVLVDFCNKEQKVKAGIMKAVKEKQAFVEHFANGGKVEDFKPQESRKVVIVNF